MFSALAVLMLVSACIGVEQPVVAPAAPAPTEIQTGGIPTAVVTLLPEPSDTPAVVETVALAQPTDTQSVTRAVPAVPLALTPGAPAGQPWQDCSIAGGWVGCAAVAPMLAARLAFFNSAGPAVMALDLGSATGWAVPSAVDAADPRISWSPMAAYLLAAQDAAHLVVYAADGTPQGSLTLDEDGAPPSWQPNAQLAAAETIQSEAGALARLEQDSDLRWQVVYESAPGTQPQRLNLETEASDRLYHLISFVPGTNLLLGQTYFAGNQAMMQGAQLFTFDVQTGERRDLEAMAPLGWQAAYAWQAAGQAGQPGLLAFVDTGGPQIGLPTISILDFASGSLNRPLPQGVAVADPAWQLHGSALAFAANSTGDGTPPEAASLYALPAIYLLIPETNEVRTVTQPPAGARDGLPTWTADGQWLLYARYFDVGVLEVHAVRPDGSQDHLIVSGLPADCPSEGPGCPWGRWLAMAAR